jgi:hypothetical protein
MHWLGCENRANEGFSVRENSISKLSPAEPALSLSNGDS